MPVPLGKKRLTSDKWSTAQCLPGIQHDGSSIRLLLAQRSLTVRQLESQGHLRQTSSRRGCCPRATAISVPHIGSLALLSFHKCMPYRKRWYSQSQQYHKTPKLKAAYAIPADQPKGTGMPWDKADAVAPADAASDT
eukprot:scaffold5931_cov410-Prasinococcus_capsulatus_cf.AAC.5